MIQSDLYLILIYCVVLTIILECGLSFILGVRKLDLILVLLAQILTNPLLNISSILIGYYCGPSYKNTSLMIFEVMAVIIEGFLYWKVLDYKKINPFLLSLILNVFSFGMGFVINMLLF